jgi:nucleoside-diphosphate-sugar epimerase
MIIGNGLIAQAFHRYIGDKNIIIFASGVSNSKSCTLSDCNREKLLLEKTFKSYGKQILFVYFSSCSISNSNLTNDAYHIHKKNMESMVYAHSNSNIIFRLPNVVGKIKNLNTLFYYLVNKIQLQEEFYLWSGAKRNIIDIDDVVSIATYIIDNNLFKNEITNIANLNDNTVDEIVYEISKYLGIKAKYSIVQCDDNYYIDTLKTKSIITNLDVSFNSTYLENIIAKYITIQN